MSNKVTLESLLEEIHSLKSAIASALSFTKETLDLGEAANYIHQSKSHLYKLTSQNLIPHYKPNGKKIYFKRSELDDWVLKNKAWSADELEQKAQSHLVKGA